VIYFLVNNNFHYYDVSLHLQSLSENRVSLIQIPHTLDADIDVKEFEENYTFQTPFAGLMSHLKINKIISVQNLIRSKIKPGPDDVLILYTEFEILNQFIVKLFNENGAKVFLLEEGMPTYISYCTKSRVPLSLKFKLKLAYIRKVLRYDFVKYLSLNGFGYPQIEDSYIDGVLFYFDAHIKRRINNYRISKAAKQVRLTDPSKVIFLNEEMYLYYMGWESYLNEMRRVILSLSKQFETVFFKFHPREDQVSRRRIREEIGMLPNLQFVEDDTPVETLIVEIRAKYAVSFFSAALMNLHFMGIDPIYIYPFIPGLLKHDNVKTIQSFLESIRYEFPDSLDVLKLEGRCRVPEPNDALSLGDFIRNISGAV